MTTTIITNILINSSKLLINNIKMKIKIFFFQSNQVIFIVNLC
jgi:hypothetical protein